MMSRLKNILSLSAAVLILGSCGSVSTGNDQGVSFTLYGMFKDSTCGEGMSGAVVQISADPESNGSGSGVLASLGLQNNLAQAIRTRRAHLKYYVEGADVQPPSTSQPLGLFLAPGTISDNSSLPTGVQGDLPGTPETAAASTASTRASALKNVGCAEIELVPPEILTYLNFNRDTLPEAPYKMRVEVSVSGIGTAGDEYTTNPLDTLIQVVQDNIITPSPAADGSTNGAASTLLDQQSTSDQNTEIIPVEAVQ